MSVPVKVDGKSVSSRNTAYGLCFACRRALTEKGKRHGIGAVLVGVLAARAAKVPGGRRRGILPSLSGSDDLIETPEWARRVRPHRSRRSSLHLLEPQRQDAIDRTVLDRLARQAQRRRPVEQLLFILTYKAACQDVESPYT